MYVWTYIALSDCGSKSWTCRFMFLYGSDLSRITMLSVPERTPEDSFKSTWRALAHAFYGPWGLIFSAMPPGPPSPAIQFLLMMTYACDKGHRHDFLLSLSNSVITFFFFSVITFEWNRTAPLELWALHHSWNSFGDVQGWKLRKGHWGSRLARRHAALYTVKAGGKSGSQKWIVWCLPHGTWEQWWIVPLSSTMFVIKLPHHQCSLRWHQVSSYLSNPDGIFQLLSSKDLFANTWH